LRKDGGVAQHGGVAIYVKDDIKLDRFDMNMNMQIIIILRSFGAKCDHAAIPEVSQD
jgi:hypothetical protein